jgi:membrane protein DedA with SNARE-associated domain
MEMTTNEFVQFLFRHGEAFLFIWILAEQAGLPVPTFPLLLAAGSLASVGQMNFAWSVVLAWAACLMADSLWFLIGRWRGPKVLWFLCRISLDPDSCAHRIKAAFRRHGARVLLVAKFVPGLNFATAPLAGVSGVSPLHFLILDSFASVLWAGGYMTLGYIFRGQFVRVATYVSGLAAILVVVLTAATAALIGFNIIRGHGWLFSIRAGESSPARHREGEPRAARAIGV